MRIPVISMQASRCPDATVQMRHLVRKFAAQSELLSIELESIEPSLVRSLPAFIAAESLPIQIQQLDGREITQDDYASWAEHFDEVDYSDISVINRFVLQKITTPVV